MDRNDLITTGWDDYELIDSGEGQKLERYGDMILSRPESQALWNKKLPERWSDAHATFAWAGGEGSWTAHKDMRDEWNMSWKDAAFSLRPTSFKHTGIFPEQAGNWEWIKVRTHAMERPLVLNLFGYTGIATVVAAQAGAAVTHVDSSKQSLTWARENAELSQIPDTMIRYMHDDALAFAKREVRRGARYKGIILDPPSFGRGAKGEVWKIERDLPVLLDTLKHLLAEEPGSFLLLNGYAAGYAAVSFAQLVESVFPGRAIEYGDLCIAESSAKRVVAAGIFTRFLI